MQNKVYTRLDEKTILFGTYPQTIKADNITITDTTNDKGYFLGSDGEWYAKVVATPNGTYKFSNGATVEGRKTYYFKVEPIKWRILSENDGKAILMCDSIIANHRFDASSNNYEASEIRKWLNEEFLGVAFDEAQRNLILTTTVDNSVSRTRCSKNKHARKNTNDKIFLLSSDEVANIDARERRMQTSDYSRAAGAYTDCNGKGWWWLCSPFCECDFSALGIDNSGCVDFNDAYHSCDGVVPALQIQL